MCSEQHLEAGPKVDADQRLRTRSVIEADLIHRSSLGLHLRGHYSHTTPVVAVCYL